ncbi:hypothetical protein K7432_013736 [Basidiobolus ranarum]|uniref:FAD-binding domain-containing protein n=1 Tax=Basidiobolus ranarum TaxID=34480 RepID=A0ABR2VQK4_9FUNG
MNCWNDPINSRIIFEQLGIADQVDEISLPALGITACTASDKKVGGIPSVRHCAAWTGYGWNIVHREDLHKILLSLIPKDTIQYNKKVVAATEEESEVTVICEDTSVYRGDILIGADGVYSKVRESMFTILEKQGVLSRKDIKPAAISNVALLCLTELKEDVSSTFMTESDLELKMFRGTPYSTLTFPVYSGKMTTAVFLNATDWEPKDIQAFKNSDRSKIIESFSETLLDNRTSCGLTLREVIHLTKSERMTLVSIEEKLLKRWHTSRIVLIGDACHKFHPVLAAGGNQAFLDAVVLANCIHGMVDVTPETIQIAFKSYHSSRYWNSMVIYISSSMVGKLFLCQTWLQTVIGVILLSIPIFILDIVFKRLFCKDLPQAAFLPLIPPTGTVKPYPQKYSTPLDYDKPVVCSIEGTS